ncbi:hypothetical protein FQN54_002155 [Arachnomyces sp. PD_36]|nr:hypothetical protein FQN54_002155 [Arachnomyces sp. PD_36]
MAISVRRISRPVGFVDGDDFPLNTLGSSLTARATLSRCTQTSPLHRLPHVPSLRPNYQTPSRSFKTFAPAFAASSSSPNPSTPREDGVAFRKHKLSASELRSIFLSTQLPTPVGNRLLRVLHGRRLSGTLDLDLPADLKRTIPQTTIDEGLEWLRLKYPIDEDAAILQRIEREEEEEEAKLIQRAEKLGLYKPQSGHYGAELGKEGNVYGKSVIQDVREANEAKNKEAEELARKEWLESEAKEADKLKTQLKRNTELQKFEESAIVEARPRADPNVRPALAWIQKHHLEATNNDIDTSKLNKFWRIFPSAIVTAITIGVCYLISENYKPPSPEDRIWRDTPPAASTALSIIGANVLILALWRAWPPAWKLLNRYFISVPMYPYSLSMVGNVFSHQSPYHLGMNMLGLWLIGTKLHEDVGRGDFMAIYLASGVFGSLTSLATNVMSNKLTVTSLGASGAVCGVLTAWCILHWNERLVFQILPSSWRDTLSTTGGVFLTGIVASEVLALAFRRRLTFLRLSPLVDRWAHLGGFAGGAACGLLWKSSGKERNNVRQGKKSKEGIWGSWFGWTK